MKQILIIFSVAFFSLHVIAQQKKNSTLAYAGENKVFIYNVFKPCSQEHPDQKSVGIKLERQAPGESSWKTVGTFSCPESFPEFESAVNTAKRTAFIKSDAGEKLSVWTKFHKCHCFDSIAFFLPQQVYSIAFNVILADTNVKNDNTYIYKVSQVDKDGKELLSYTTNEVRYPAVVNYETPRFYKRDATTLHTSVTWYTKGGESPKAMRIYRKSGSRKNFELSGADYTINISHDTTYYRMVDNKIMKDEIYDYTISPTNFFGGGSNVHSDTVAITNYQLKDVMLPQLFTAYGMDRQNLIHLSFRTHKPEYLASIQVFRSTHYDKDYVKIGSASPFDTMYEDRSATSAVKYYYYLMITDKLGHLSNRSAKIFGIYYSERKPAMPLNVRVVTTSKGIQIKWNTDADNIAGYYVSRCRGVSGKMQIISKFILHRDTSAEFTDTMTLNPGYTYGYMIQQENAAHVLSNPSNIVYVQPASKASLFAVKQLQSTLNGKAVILFWEDMRGINKGLKGYSVFRKESNKGDFTQLAYLPPQNSTFNDTTVKSGSSYEYAVSCIDMANHEGPKGNSSIVNIPGNAESISAPAGLKAFTAENSIQLEWSPSGSGSAKAYNVYRYQRGVAPTLITKVSAAPFSYTDTQVKANELYFYFVTAVQANGEESAPCKEISVRGM